MNKILTAFLIALGMIGVSAAQSKDLSRWVNPFIGTGGHGHTFPGATMPFGMVQLSPDTRIDNWDGSSGYHYSDDIIYGFSHTHLNGTGIPDYCDILFMPTVDSTREFGTATVYKSGTYKGFSSKFSHADERAEPGYYSVRLDDKMLLAELTATTRVGFHRYTFPASKMAGINLDLEWRDKRLGSELKVVGDRRVEGFRRSSSWAKDQTVYFVAEFSKAFKGHGSGSDKGSGAFFGFDTQAGEQILLKVAISNVSLEGARKNLAAELPGWDFEKVRADARAAWNKELSKIEVSGGTDAQTTTFYTALYHTMIQPNVFSDVDGQYRGMDGKVHSVWSPGFSRPLTRGKPPKGGTPSASEQYTVFSLWDTFRAAHPLYTIIDQKRTVDFINTFIRQYEQGGRLPVWELAANETDCMIGYHSVSVIADAMAKGIKGFDYEKAYAAAKHSAELDHFGLAGYKKRGYISMEDENESVSRTLEYAYDDWCIAQMAKILMTRESKSSKNASKASFDPKTGIASFPIDVEKTKYLREFEHYLNRARYFENLFDSKTGFFRPKKNGGFVEPFAPNEVTFGFTEGNSWQYSFFVPHDVTRLEQLMGGREKFVAKLDELFTTDQKLAGREQADLTGLIGQYAHGNEPSHHIAYLYNYAHQPWKTQKLVRQIMDEFYKNAPDGLIGNEDCGQMSAWYVLSAGGFYPVTPGDGVYAIGTPLFPEVTYRLENGKTFTIKAKNVSPANKYLLNAKLNGAPYKKAFITHEDITKGGVLEFAMIDTPVATSFTEFPVSLISVNTVSVPVITGDRSIRNASSVTMSTVTPDAKIYYTTDGSEPAAASTVFSAPFTIDRTTTVKAIAIDPKGNASKPVTANFVKPPNDWTVKVISPYSTQYTGGGDNAIVDGIRGTVNFASGEWQGVQGRTYEAVIDLQREMPITELGGSFLQVAGPWIWMPDRIEFETSSDGITFAKAAEIKPGFPQTEMTPTVREYRQKITPTRARYVRVRAFNIGKIPSWHPGAGGDPWIFVDEILVN
ncbi:MAG: GH92 family glycosyl hydrolase [Pyrinomonadaceae bacterium]|nr:GH92 family glycosyl hydrolase [Pyrinomonadaceae bacterium]